MKIPKTMSHITSLLLLMVSVSAFAQVSPRDINGWRFAAGEGIAIDTNVSFSLRMTLAGEDTLRNSASTGQDVSIIATIRPDMQDIGQTADIVVVDISAVAQAMRDTDGNFVSWRGSLKTLIPYKESVTLSTEQDIEVFSGQLGSAGRHRIFVGFLVNGALYFTPTALRLDIEEAQQSPRELAIDLFNSAISTNIVQQRCVVCHVIGGAAAGQSSHLFVRSSDSDHLTLNLEAFEELLLARGVDLILNKVRGMSAHGGGVQLTTGSSDYNNLEDFLGLLDQASQ